MSAASATPGTRLSSRVMCRNGTPERIVSAKVQVPALSTHFCTPPDAVVRSSATYATVVGPCPKSALFITTKSYDDGPVAVGNPASAVMTVPLAVGSPVPTVANPNTAPEELETYN